MKKSFQFPDVGEGIAEGEIVRWLVSEGDRVREDEPILEIETDKAVVSLPSPYTGKILSRRGKPGEIIPVGTVLITVEIAETAETETEAPTGKASIKKKDAGSVVGQIEESEEEFITRPVPHHSDRPHNDKIRAVPSVRRYAKERGIDLAEVRGTGKEGRITRDDVKRAASLHGEATIPAIGRSSLGPIERIPFRGVRRSAAKRVMTSSQHVAAVTFVEDADITNLEKVRSNKKQMAEDKGFKLTTLPFIIKSVVAGLKAYPYLNASLDEEKDEILLKKYYNIGIAVDTPEGLMVFVIKNANDKSILALAEEIFILTEKAFSRTIDLSELKGGSFTLTNYGVIGGIYGTPIINYPEAGILGLGKIEDKAVVRSDEIVIRKMLPLSLTFDHRIIYGAEAARFMNTVIKHLEDPDLMLVEGK
ncbi:MAG: dihydrolipoamide acetyltransferase family protein [Nitrospiria bacterium]